MCDCIYGVWNIIETEISKDGKGMKVTVKIVETYTKYEEVEIEDTGKIDESYDEVNKMVDSGDISLPSADKESLYDMNVTLM